MDNLLRILKAAGDETRLRVLRMLAVKPLCVCEVMSVLRMAQSTASKHLKLLAESGLISAAPGGSWTIYSLAKAPAGSPAARVLELVRRAKPTDQSRKDAALAKDADRVRICQQRTERPFSRTHRR